VRVGRSQRSLVAVVEAEEAQRLHRVEPVAGHSPTIASESGRTALPCKVVDIFRPRGARPR
jgi:hypothetical protein